MSAPLRALCTGLLLAAAAPAFAAPDPCAGIEHCQNLGPFTATALKVNVTRQDGPTAYQGVKTTVRITNTGKAPLVLGYRDKSSVVTDNNGLRYAWSSKAYGIGLVGRDTADPQFELAPGESREASFEGVLQYSLRTAVAGSVFQHDVVLVALQPQQGRVREARDYAVSFSDLRATAGFQAAPAGRAPASPPPVAGPAAVPANAAADPCGGDPACQSQGPLEARVTHVTVADTDRPTAYRSVRTTVRFRNLSDRPLILGWRSDTGGSLVTDDRGVAYRWSAKAFGIGRVDRGSADPQFEIGPGEAREASFEAVAQYNKRATVIGNVFQQDMTIAELQVVGPGQVRTVHDYALSFGNLRGSGLPAPTAGNAMDAVSSLLKSLKH